MQLCETFTSETEAEFETAARPMIEWLNKNCHPHVKVIITTTDAELVEGQLHTGQIYDYITD